MATLAIAGLSWAWPSASDFGVVRESTRTSASSGLDPDANSLRAARLHDLRQGFRQGTQAFGQDVARGGFMALTGVEPRQPIARLEGATFSRSDDGGITFVLADGTVVPPLSRQGYEALRQTVPASQRWVLDDKLYWLLQRNPALPLIAAGLERGTYQTLLQNGVFDTDRFYLGPLMGYLFWAADQAQVPLAELMPLVEVHLLTLEFPYFQALDAQPSGTVHSFNQQELALTNQQYLLRSLVMSPLEPWARLEAIKRVEAPNVKSAYTGSTSTSTTIALGRLPLPTPTAAEDTPGVHALSIAHLVHQGVSLFPSDVERAALGYESTYTQLRTQEARLSDLLDRLANQHEAEILGALENYRSDGVWTQIGLTPVLGPRSVAQMDTAHLLGIYATRHESLQPLAAAQSYPLARQDVIQFFQTNSPGLSDGDLLRVLFNDQAFNPALWRYLYRQLPTLRPQLAVIQAQVDRLEASYRAAAVQEAVVFRQLQAHQLDISTEAFSRLSVALARRLGDLVAAKFQPSDRTHPDYLRFSRGLLPYLRDMPSLDAQWGGTAIKRYGLGNYVVPDLIALTPDQAPTLTAIHQLWFAMVSAGDLNRWDFATLAQVMGTGNTLSINLPPSALAPEQDDLLPLVARYRSPLKRATGVDGTNASSVIHGETLQDFRIPTWPAARTPGPARLDAINPAIVQQLFPALPPDRLPDLIWLLSSGSGEIALAPTLVLLARPEFTARPDGALDLWFDANGDRVVFPEVSRHFEAVYYPIYMTRIALPREPGPAYADALNQAIRRSHALYGGYMPSDMTLPTPLQGLEN